MVMGSDYPFDMGTEDPADRVRTALTDPDALRAVLGANAETLFGLSGKTDL